MRTGVVRQSPAAAHVYVGNVVCAPADTWIAVAAAAPLSVPAAVKSPGATGASVSVTPPAACPSRLTVKVAAPDASAGGSARLICPSEQYSSRASASEPL